MKLRSLRPRPPHRVLRAPLCAALIAVAATTFAAAPVAAVSAGSSHPRTSYESYVATSVRNQLNAERRAHGLAPVYASSQLMLSARRHNITMAARNTLSHQLPGEASFTGRISATGYRWTWAGENVAYTTSMHATSVVALQVMMYNERPPNDGHRHNILNSHFHDVGVDVYVDFAHHKIWLTTDFGHR